MLNYDIEVKTNSGEIKKMSEFKSKVLLIVNTASACGFTPQYKGLEELYAKYKEKGLEILAFPCNQFGAQEPGSDSEIKEFCDLNYSVSFPLFAKIDVNGDEAHPLYKDLKSKAKGLMGTEAIKWNFTKFLVSRDGEKILRFAPQDTPESMTGKIEALLSE
jgi:glutathione peroxidase